MSDPISYSYPCNLIQLSMCQVLHGFCLFEMVAVTMLVSFFFGTYGIYCWCPCDYAAKITVSVENKDGMKAGFFQ